MVIFCEPLLLYCGYSGPRNGLHRLAFCIRVWVIAVEIRHFIVEVLALGKHGHHKAVLLLLRISIATAEGFVDVSSQLIGLRKREEEHEERYLVALLEFHLNFILLDLYLMRWRHNFIDLD